MILARPLIVHIAGLLQKYRLSDWTLCMPHLYITPSCDDKS